MPSDEQKKKDQDIQREIRSGREFTLADFISQQGGNFLKGESPVPKLVQATTEINLFIANYLKDTEGALQSVLQTMVENEQSTVSRYLNTPLEALKVIINQLLTNDSLLFELVRQVDAKWGQMYDERPYFQQPGQDPHPNDEYTHESVKKQLEVLLSQIEEIINKR
jgi:hypothetical protein